MKQNKAILALLGVCVSVAVLTASCGGGNDKNDAGSPSVASNPASGTGSGRITIAWPEPVSPTRVAPAAPIVVKDSRFKTVFSISGVVGNKTDAPTRGVPTRLIPQATGSIVIELFTTDPRTDAGAQATVYYWIARPASGSSQITVGPVEARSYFVRINALPTTTVTSAQGTGNAPVPAGQVPVATTVGTLEIKRAPEVASLNATLGSTITNLVYSLTLDGSAVPVTGALVPGKTYRLSVKSFDAQNREVITTGNNFFWTGFGTDAVPNSTAGQSITARFSANATVNFLVRDLETGREYGNSINTSTGTFGQPGSVLGVAGLVEESPFGGAQSGLSLLGIVSNLDGSGDNLYNIFGEGPSSTYYSGYYTPDEVGAFNPKPLFVALGFGNTPRSAIRVPSGFGSEHLMSLVTNGTRLSGYRYDQFTLYPEETQYTAPTAIAGYDEARGSLYVGYEQNGRFHVSILPKDQLPFIGTPTTFNLLPVGTNPSLVGVNDAGDVYVKTTKNGRSEVRRYDDQGRLSSDFGPMTVNDLYVARNGKIIVGDDVYSEDGRIRLGSFPPSPFSVTEFGLEGTGSFTAKEGKYYYFNRHGFSDDQINTTPAFLRVVLFSVDEVE